MRDREGLGAPRVVLVVNQDWFFLSHRLPIARGARDAGAAVTIVAGDTGQGAAIRAAGFDFVPLPISRKGISPWAEWVTLRFLRRTYKRLRPDLVHHVTLKPVIYGSLAARAVGNVAVVNALSGMGYAFSSNNLRARVLRPLLRRLLRLTLKYRGNRVILQNPEDLSDLKRMGAVRPEHVVVIRGVGVDAAQFQVTPERPGIPIVLLAARMLWDKGIHEFVEAARSLRTRGVPCRFVLVGEPDTGNPSAVPAERLRAWVREDVVEWWGQRADMPEVLAQASIVVLPTVYGEGVPKVLLEAAACGRPIVATDTRGCREIVRPGINGALVPPRDATALADAINSLLVSPDLRARYGRAGRDIAVREFAEEDSVRQTLDVYRSALGGRWPQAEAANARL